MSNKGLIDMPLKSFRIPSSATNPFVLFVLLLICLNCRVNFADDWSQWRGPQRDNVSKETGLLKEWPEGGPRLHLRIEGFGTGIAAPAVVGDRAYTLGVYGGYEHVIAFSTETGERLWLSKLGVPSSDDFVSAHRIMRWLSQRTPTVHDGKLYAVSTYGTLVCISVEDGKLIWSKDFRKEYGVERQKWGYCDYPLVDGDALICVPGGTQATVVALNRNTGAEIWRRLLTSDEEQKYPVVRSVHSATLRGEINETDFYFVATDDAIQLLRCSDGASLFTYRAFHRTTAFSHTPILDKSNLFVTNGYNGGIAKLELTTIGTALEVREVFRNRTPLDTFVDHGLLANGSLFLSRPGTIERFDPLTGLRLEGIRVSRHAMTFADERLYCFSSTGTVSLMDASSGKLETVGSFQLPDKQQSNGVTLPVVANGRLYLRDDDRLFSFDVTQRKPVTTKAVVLSVHNAPKVAGNQRVQASVFLPTPNDVVARMLQEAGLRAGQHLVDLGSGDGRIVIAAAKTFGAHAVGYELDAELVAIATSRIEQQKVGSLARIEAANMYTAELSNANVLAIFLDPESMELLKPQIARMPPGSIVVSHQFEFIDLKADKTVKLESVEDAESHMIHIYKLPLQEK